MARKPRIHFPGALYHAMLRGNDKQKIFFDSEDREVFSNLVSEGFNRFGHKIYAYCWMDNHIHMAIEVGKIPLSNIMQNLAFRYTRYFNKKNGRVGHLFQGRYKAILVDKESYLLELIRYIHLNPIRAKLIRKLQDYQYCGHRGYLGIDKISWLESDVILSIFGKNKRSAVTRYINFIEQGKRDFGMSFETGEVDKQIIGNEEFIEKIDACSGVDKEDHEYDINWIIKATSKVLNIPANRIFEKGKKREVTFARNLIAYLNKRYGNSTMSSLAMQFSLDLSTLSRSVVRLEEKLQEPKVANVVKKIRNTIIQA